MSRGTKMSNFTQKNEKTAGKRGRPMRHPGERMRTIAWYHWLQRNNSPKFVMEYPQFAEYDLATIYRYRNGQISPSIDLLDVDNPIFKTARVFYEVGPIGVPLWDALWGALSPSDYRLADRVLPNGDWPTVDGAPEEMIFDDQMLARIMAFRRIVVQDESLVSDLETFAAAARVCRAWKEQGTENPIALRWLLEGSLALPIAREELTSYGLIKPIQEWILEEFGEEGAQEFSPVYWAPWMDDYDALREQCLAAERRRESLRLSLLSIFT